MIVGRDTLHLLPQWASMNKVVLDLLDQYQPALAVKRKPPPPTVSVAGS